MRERSAGLLATLLLAAVAAGCAGGKTGTLDGGPSGMDATVDAGTPRDAGRADGGVRDAGIADAGRDAGPMTPDSGPVEMGTHVQGGLGTLGGAPSGGRFQVLDDHFEHGGTSCGGPYCVFGGAGTGQGLSGAP